MSGWKKLASAAAASGGALNAEDLFSTYLYDGTGSTQTITNGIDLSGEGGMVWIKDRHASSQYPSIFDTERGAFKLLYSSQDWAETNGNASTYPPSGSLRQFNSDGFEVGSYDDINRSGSSLCAWTFRKAPKFFDIVTYTGTGTNRTISHNLGSTPGMMIVKRLDASGFWAVYHKDLNGGSNPATKFLRLQETSPESGNSGYWNNTEPTDSVFSLGINSYTNHNGGSYVAYLFADNDGGGEFGPTGDQDIIKCGTYTGTGNTSDPFIDVGFEPQWVLIKARTSSTDWVILDNMRGWATDMQQLNPNSTATESALSNGYIRSTGFQFDTATARLNSQGVSYVYMAIRRGPMAVPESASDVFLAKEYGGTSQYSVGFPTDLMIGQTTAVGAGTRVFDRLRGNTKQLFTYSANGDNTTSYGASFDLQDDFQMEQFGSTTVPIGLHWKRAPNYFDIVAYTGSSSAQNINHNLGVEPEMIWVKRRTGSTDWGVYHKDTGTSKYLSLNQNYDAQSYSLFTATSDTTFSVIGNDNYVNASGSTYIAYLFATLSGVSKVGSYTGTGSALNVDCGFSSGAQFVLIKNISSSGTNWVYFDAVRGIVAGNDPKLELNTTSAEQTGYDWIDPYSAGFTINPLSSYVNSSGNTYIFYAVAA